MANAMDNDFREKIKQKVVRLGGGSRIVKEPYLTEAMNTAIRTIAEHKGWTWMKIGPIEDYIYGEQFAWDLPDHVDEFSDMTLIVGAGGTLPTCLEYLPLEEYARRRTAPDATEATNFFDAYTICERQVRFIHEGAGGVAPLLQLWASLSPSHLDDVYENSTLTVIGVRNAMPKNLDNCLTYGILAELLGDEAGAKWADKFNTQLNRLGLLDDKSPDKIRMGDQR